MMTPTFEFNLLCLKQAISNPARNLALLLHRAEYLTNIT
jgi:hypothetical protein